MCCMVGATVVSVMNAITVMPALLVDLCPPGILDYGLCVFRLLDLMEVLSFLSWQNNIVCCLMLAW